MKTALVKKATPSEVGAVLNAFTEVLLVERKECIAREALQQYSGLFSCVSPQISALGIDTVEESPCGEKLVRYASILHDPTMDTNIVTSQSDTTIITELGGDVIAPLQLGDVCLIIEKYTHLLIPKGANGFYVHSPKGIVALGVSVHKRGWALMADLVDSEKPKFWHEGFRIFGGMPTTPRAV
jgi:hypothetical protein